MDVVQYISKYSRNWRRYGRLYDLENEVINDVLFLLVLLTLSMDLLAQWPRQYLQIRRFLQSSLYLALYLVLLYSPTLLRLLAHLWSSLKLNSSDLPPNRRRELKYCPKYVDDGSSYQRNDCGDHQKYKHFHFDNVDLFSWFSLDLCDAEWCKEHPNRLLYTAVQVFSSHTQLLAKQSLLHILNWNCSIAIYFRLCVMVIHCSAGSMVQCDRIDSFLSHSSMALLYLRRTIDFYFLAIASDSWQHTTDVNVLDALCMEFTLHWTRDDLIVFV